MIKINPTTLDKIPTTPSEISDRRNELEGNVSLFHSLQQVEDINTLILRGELTDEFLARRGMKGPFKIPKAYAENPDLDYHIPMIEMSEDLAKSLDYESKLDRSPENISSLIQDGEKQGKKFLETRFGQML